MAGPALRFIVHSLVCLFSFHCTGISSPWAPALPHAGPGPCLDGRHTGPQHIMKKCPWETRLASHTLGASSGRQIQAKV